MVISVGKGYSIVGLSSGMWMSKANAVYLTDWRNVGCHIVDNCSYYYFIGGFVGD